MRFILSPQTNPFANLAIEEALLESPPVAGPILFICRNRPCVVIGKHQNPWRECNLSAMAMDHVPLLRRISGGGAVYHDEGNLNFSLIDDRKAYDQDANYAFVIAVLAKLGINATRSGKSNIALDDGKKISGNAFCYRRDRALHHGTLLVHADLDRLARYLAAAPLDLNTHAIASEPAPVTNLGLDVDVVCDAFRSACEGEVPCPNADPVRLQNAQTWDWLFGKTPRFDSCGEDVRHGVIQTSPDLQRIGQRFTPKND